MLPQKRHHTARGTQDAHVLVDAILSNQEQQTDDESEEVTLEELLQNNAQAQQLHEAWVEEQESESESDEEEEQAPTKWEDVVLETPLDAEDASTNRLTAIVGNEKMQDKRDKNDRLVSTHK